MKLLFSLSLVILSLPTVGQKVGYLNKNFIPVSFKAEATYYTETTKTSQIAGTVKTFLLDGTLFSEETFSNIRTKTRDGVSKTYYPNGFVKSEVIFKNGNYNGPLKTYYPNRRLRRAELYENGNLVTGRCFSTTGYDTAYYAYHQGPSFPGGEAGLYKYLEDNSRYAVTTVEFLQSQQLLKKYVVAKFVVGTTGEISDILISVPLSSLHDREVMRLISLMPKWSPATQDGEPVSREITMPIGFR